MMRLWLGLMILTAAISLWFTGKATHGLWVYSRLAAQTQAAPKEWSVLEIGSSEYVLVSRYAYRIGEAEYEGKTIFKKPSFLNRASAEASIKDWTAHSWNVWYDPSHPLDSSLQKIFPFKNCIHALLALGVLGYFYYLRSYAQRLAI